MKKRLIALLCLLTMMATMISCGKNKSNPEEMTATEEKRGRYMETTVLEPDLEAGESRIGAFINEFGQMEYYTTTSDEMGGNSKLNRYLLINGTYEKSTVNWADMALTDCVMYPKEICLGQDGKRYLLMEAFDMMIDEDGIENYQLRNAIVRNCEDGNSYEEVTPDYWKENNNEQGSIGLSIQGIQVSQDQILCYKENYGSELTFFDLNTKKEADMSFCETEQGYVIDQNTLYYIPMGGSEVKIRDLNNNEEKEIAFDSIGSNSMLQVSQQGDIYLLDSKGIHIYKAGGTMWETIVDGSLCSMCVPSYQAINFFILPGDYDIYYVIYNSMVEGKDGLFARYQYDSSVPATFTKELTIYSLWDNTSLREAISKYMKEHTDTKINYVVAISDASSATLTEQIRALNTEVLAGNGADIFLLDGLPIDSYIQKGVLMDLSDVFQKQIDNQELLTNITKNYIKDEKIYCMPMRFFMPIYAMSEDVTNDTESIKKMEQLALSSDKKLMEPLTYESLVRMFLYTYMDEIYTLDGSIDATKLEAFMTAMKTIADHTDATVEGDDTFGIMIEGMMQSNQRIQEILCGNAMQLVMMNTYLTMGYAGDMSDFAIMKACTDEVSGMYHTVNNTYVPNGVVGINKATKNAELAKDFITTLFTKENQSQHLMDGFPVNIGALNTWTEETVGEDNFYSLSLVDEEGQVHSVNGGPLSLEDKKNICEMTKSLTTPVNNDTVLEDMIVSGVLTYLKQENSLEQAVSETTDKVNLYLNE